MPFSSSVPQPHQREYSHLETLISGTGGKEGWSGLHVSWSFDSSGSFAIAHTRGARAARGAAGRRDRTLLAAALGRAGGWGRRI